MGFLRNGRALIEKIKAERDKRNYEYLKKKAISGILSDEETRIFAEETAKRTEKYLNEERQRSAELYRKGMRAENYFLKEMKKFEDRMGESESSKLEQRIVKSQADKLISRASVSPTGKEKGQAENKEGKCKPGTLRAFMYDILGEEEVEEIFGGDGSEHPSDNVR